MNISQDAKNNIEKIADEALEVFEKVSNKARTRLQESLSSINANALANNSLNTFVEGKDPTKALNNARQYNIEIYNQLAIHPASARVVVIDENDKKFIYYFTRGAADPIPDSSIKLASLRNNEIGPLASKIIGDEHTIKVNGKNTDVTIVENTRFTPSLENKDWDSAPSIFSGIAEKPITIFSLRSFLRTSLSSNLDALEQYLAQNNDEDNIMEGIGRNAMKMMELRDQHVLDNYQSEIFRLPLNSRLSLQGPPGTGKTTTLIKRLGQKLDQEFLETDERRLVSISTDMGVDHSRSWLMFTPTDLLRLYVKEAFACENIPASDEHIKTWSYYRRELGMNHFNLLRNNTNKGFILKAETTPILQPQTQFKQIEWFSEFNEWQISTFFDELTESAKYLSSSEEKKVSALGDRLISILNDFRSKSNESIFIALDKVNSEIEALFKSKKEITDKVISQALNLQFNRDNNFIAELAKYIATLTDTGDLEENEDDDEDETPASKSEIVKASETFKRVMKIYATAAVKKKNISKNSQAGKIISWLGERSLAESELFEVGKNLITQSAAKYFIDAVKRYINNISKRYRAFRRKCQTEKKWYNSDGFSTLDLHPLELDIILLAILKNSNALIANSSIFSNLDKPLYAALKPVVELYKNQVLVDEATDFSAIQLACMFALTNPRINSFFICGDFNQRLTSWGVQTENDLKWIIPDIKIKSIAISYRQSHTLNEFSKKIIQITDGLKAESSLPKDVIHEGVAPALGMDISTNSQIVEWLKHRIIEIREYISPLPTIAILVTQEDQVKPIADDLKSVLADSNINVVACYDGQIMGQNNDVRVFDIKHIKGLEFEAVFFIDIDKLSEIYPDLFDKYLYVGATRAATYLGITCAGKKLPHKIETLEPLFIDNWK